jgi:dipeptidyl aminopeptidase/acylaminoacyl peptidase
MFSASSLMPGEPAAQTVSSNGKIVYVGSDGVNNDIFTINADGSEVSQLTTDGRSNDNPEWSPDGTKIAFDSWVDANTSNIYVMNANGTGRQHLTTTSPSQGGDFQATWAPDGGWLAFVSTRDGNSELYRMNANGSAQTRLTVEPAADKQPSISPEGRIAFASDRANADYEAFDLYVLDPEIGREPTRLTFDGDPDENFFRHDSLNPVWSPDGTRIAFDSTRSGNREVWVINADGSGLTNVSDDPAQDYEPAWSPDGSQITFTSSRAGDLDIWAVDAPPTTAASFSALEVGTDSALAASEPRNLTPGDGLNAVSPDWGAAPTCTIQGSPRADTLTGTSRADVICSLGGNDTVEGEGGQDIIKGGLGDDTLKGQGANDRLVGGGGADGLFGGTGDDTLNSKDGVSGNDSLSGGTHVNGDKKVTDTTEKSIVGFP